jgi:hypothetical protein
VWLLARGTTTARVGLRNANSGEIINGNIVTITGIYGLKHINDFGYAQSPKDYQNIIYYKGSKGWELLKGVAERIGGQMIFSK